MFFKKICEKFSLLWGSNCRPPGSESKALPTRPASQASDASVWCRSHQKIYRYRNNFPLCDQGRAFLYEEGDSERVPAMSSKTMDASFRSEGLFGCHGFMSYFVGDAQFLFELLLVSFFLFCWLRLNSGVFF